MTQRTEAAVLSPLALLAGMSGNLMEWYDFALYGVLAATLGQLFFPDGNRLLALLSVFGVFAAGYVMRVLGGAAFGHVGDRLGRRRALLLSATVMAIATALVGCLPTYASAGVAAPVLFTLLRLFQGLSWLAERFPRPLRASGLGLAYNGAAGILGGTTPLVSTALTAATGSWLAPAGYVMLACLVSLAVALRTPETGREPLRVGRRQRMLSDATLDRTTDRIR